MQNRHLTLFGELPTNTKFRFENAFDGKVFVKSSDKGAHHDGAYQPVNAGVLVFRVANPILVVEFTQADGAKSTAIEVVGRWALISDQNPTDQYFNTLDDVINHLGG